MPGVRAIHQEADAVDLLDQRAPEGAQRNVSVVTAAAHMVVPVVSEVHLPDAQVVIELDHGDIAGER